MADLRLGGLTVNPSVISINLKLKTRSEGDIQVEQRECVGRMKDFSGELDEYYPHKKFREIPTYI